MKLIETNKEQFVGRHYFVGTAAATMGAGTLMTPYVFGQSTTENTKVESGHPTKDSEVANMIASPGNRAAGPPHITLFAGKKPYFADDFGSQTRIDANDLPRLNRLSIRRLLLTPKDARGPHWMTN